ncbi:MAG: alpha-amylase family glycosyl hydrolase [Anaerolineaceae bacterium]
MIDTNSIFYHIYPLGALNAPQHNDFTSQPVPRLQVMIGWLDHIQMLGVNAIYLGPVFESSNHGYDTANYYEVDRRLGTNTDLAAFSQAVHARGISLVLDGVFNHVGRAFWAFRDLRENRQGSAYTDWFVNVNFDQTNGYGDPFSYDCWQGHQTLVNLNLANPSVLEHLFGAIKMWKEQFNIDGIRLDAADALSFDFMRKLRGFTQKLDPDLWLMGEVIHGDYRQWANPDMLHATTNYELYKSLYSAHNDGNYFELAYSLNREFGEQGIYRHLPTLYSFVDNHDVNRINSQLLDKNHLWLLYLLLFSLPGVPTIYYGGEFGFEGMKTTEDWNLRPPFDLATLLNTVHRHDLRGHISRLTRLRTILPALRTGSYQEKLVAPKQFAFMRSEGEQHVLVVVNAYSEATPVSISMPGMAGWRFVDKLNNSETVLVSEDDKLTLNVPGNWGLMLVNE